MVIKFAKYIISSPTFDKCPLPDKTEYAFIGRSNVGKSSLINMLCGMEKLAKTSASIDKTFVNGNLVWANGKLNEESRGQRLLFNR